MFRLLALLPFLGTLAHAGQSEVARYSRIGSWDISFYPTAGGCQAFSFFGGRTGFFIGYDTTAGRPALDLTLLDPRWGSIEPGETYRVVLQFGARPVWTLDMRGVEMDGRPGLNIVFPADTEDARQLVEEFQRELRMTWKYGDTRLGTFTLAGSRRAFDAVRACQTGRGGLSVAENPVFSP